MSPLVLVLALTPPAPLPQISPPQPQIERRAAPRLDPRFLDFGPAIKGRGPIVTPPPRRPRLVPI